jgi:integrase
VRIGEVQALRWADIDFEKGFIEVKRSFREGRNTEPKNKKYRKVDMSPQLYSVLKTIRIEKKKTAIRKGIEFSEYVFASKKQKISNRVVFHKAFMEILKKLVSIGIFECMI